MRHSLLAGVWAVIGVLLCLTVALAEPITVKDILQLKRMKFTDAEVKAAIDRNGASGVLSPQDVQAMKDAGVGDDLIQTLRGPAGPGSPAGATDAPPISPDTREYRDPAQFFALRYPKDWTLSRELVNGTPLYAATPEKGKAGWTSMDASVAVMLVPLSPDRPSLANVEPGYFLKQELPLILLASPKLSQTGEVVPAKLGALPGARVSLKGTPKDMNGNFACEVYAAREKDVLILAQITVEEHQLSQRGALQKVLDTSLFGRKSLRPAAPPHRYSVRELADKYLGSVVMINGESDKSGASGTGFIISPDGYVATNAHVALESKGKVYPRFMARWDQSLNRKPVPLTYVGHRDEGLAGFMHWGIDVALFKLPPGEYVPCPIGSLDDVSLGDSIVVMGFPKSFDFSDRSSIVVTEGTVSRMNRTIDGAVDSILHSAKTTHGNSGGPTFSRRTGQVVAQLTYGPPNTTGLDEESQAYRDLVGLNGSIPIDRLVREFPIVADLGLKDDSQLDFLDSYALAWLFTARGSHYDARRMSERAVRLAPKSAEAHCQLANFYMKTATGEEDLAAAVKSYTEALACNPEYQDALLGLALTSAIKGDKVKALTWVDRAVQGNVSFNAHFLRARILLALQRPEEALAEAEKAKEMGRELLPDPYILAGTVRYARNEFDAGKSEFEHAAQIVPRNLQARLGVGQCFMLKKDYDAALAEFRRVEVDIPGHPMVLSAIAQAFMQQKKYADATNAYFAAYRACTTWKLPTTEEMHLGMGAAHRQLHHTSLALNWYAASLGLFPNSASVRDTNLAMAQILLEDDKAPQELALAHLLRADKLRPGDPAVKQLLQSRKWKGLSVQEIAAMEFWAKYPAGVIADLVAQTPLAFDPQTRESQAALAAAKIDDPAVLAAIKASAERFNQPAKNPNPPQPPNPPPGQWPTTVVGTWQGKVGNQVLTYTFQADGRFTAQGVQRATGTWSAANNELILVNDVGGKRLAVPYKTDGRTLQLQGANVLVLTRVQ